MNNPDDNSNDSNNSCPNFCEIRGTGPNQRVVGFGGTLSYLHSKAKEFLLKGDSLVAAQILLTIEHHSPYNAGLVQDLTTALLDIGASRSAMEKASRLTQLCPDLAGAWALLGMAHALLGERKNALEALDIALAAEMPENTSICVTLLLAILLDEYRPELEGLGKKAVAMNPDYQMGWMVLGRIQLANGKQADAKVSLERAVKIKPDSLSGREASRIHAELR